MSEIVCHIVREVVRRHRVQARPAYHLVSGEVVRHIVRPLVEEVDGGGGDVTPTNSSPPSIPATIETGVEATATPGTWSDAASVTGEWLLDGVQVATGYTYTPAAGDAGGSLVFRETAVNGAESATADSSAVTVLYNPVVISGVNRWMTLRRASGIVQDQSVLTFPEVLQGFDFAAPSGTNAPLFEAGPPPGANFDASDDYVRHATKANFNFLHSGPGTMAFILTDDFNSSQYVWASGNTSGNSVGVTVLLTATTTRIYVTNGSGTAVYQESVAVVPASGTRLIAFAWDNSSMKYYFDNALVHTSGAPGGAFGGGDSTSLPTISNTFLEADAIIHDIITADRAMTLAEITEIYNQLVAA